MRHFVTLLHTSCQAGLSAQINGERLMFVPETPEGFRATVSAPRSLDGIKGVSFLSLVGPLCTLLVKKLGRHMPEGVVREELLNLGVCVQGFLRLRSGRRDQ
jgi:hypothetical protein